jgi:hypothetical protein
VAHTRSVSHATMVLVRLFGSSHYLRVRCSLFLSDTSEPDRLPLVDAPEVGDNPQWADLIIEMSDSSLG